jgi:hypothetical protein
MSRRKSGRVLDWWKYYVPRDVFRCLGTFSTRIVFIRATAPNSLDNGVGFDEERG